jgi:hypothetical protein
LDFSADHRIHVGSVNSKSFPANYGPRQHDKSIGFWDRVRLTRQNNLTNFFTVQEKAEEGEAESRDIRCPECWTALSGVLGTAERLMANNVVPDVGLGGGTLCALCLKRNNKTSTITKGNPMKIKTQTKAGGIHLNHNQKLQVKAKVKAGGIHLNHNQAAKTLKVKTKTTAGNTMTGTIKVGSGNHNQGLKVKSKVKAGGIHLNHNQTLNIVR